MKRFLTVFAIMIVLLGFSYNAEAEFKETAFFYGGGVSYAWENFDDDELEDDLEGGGITDVQVDTDDAWGFNLFVGYRFMRHISVEGNFNWYDDFKVNIDADIFGIPAEIDFDVKIWTLMLDLRAMYPLFNDKLVPYLRAGGGYMEVKLDGDGLDEDENDFAWNLGVGVDYFVTDMVSFGLDGKYVWGTGDLDELEYIVGTFTVGFHF